MKFQEIQITSEDTELFKRPEAIAALLRQGISALDLLPPGNFRKESRSQYDALSERLTADPACIAEAGVIDAVTRSLNGIRYAVMATDFPKDQLGRFKQLTERCWWIEIGLNPGTYSADPRLELTFPDEW